MNLFKKNKKSEKVSYKDQLNNQDITGKVVSEEIIGDEKGKIKVTKKSNSVLKEEDSKILSKGARNPKDFIAPPSFDRTKEDCLKVGNKYVRSYVMNGFPSLVSVGWLNDLFNSEGDMDTAIYVVPADERGALDELTNKITQFEAQLSIEANKGNIRNITKLETTVQQLYDQRRKLEQNFESLFHIQIVSNLYTDTYEELEKQGQKLSNRLKGRKIDMSPMYLRQDEAYKAGLPFGYTEMNDKFRNFNSGALTACFPFYNSEISHKNGVFVGVNLATMTPVFIDFYDKNVLNNSNASVFGQAGSGKTFFVSLLTLRSALKGIRTVIIDPEGEYRKLTEAMGGAYIRLSTDSNTGINPFDIEEEYDEDGTIYVDIKSKVADGLNLVAVMAGGLDREQRSIVSHVLTKMYEDFGITEDPDSLYDDDTFSLDGSIVHSNKKKMPVFSNFHDKLEKLGHDEENAGIVSLANSLRMFKKGGTYDMFDRETSSNLTEFANAPIVSFDVSRLEEGILRPIGMYISMSWTWEKFVKKNPHIKKRIVCDEAWMLVNKNMQGNEYTAQFLENSARRIRKRNGGLLVASQNFIEFADNPQGKAVLTNTVVNIFLKQNSTDIDAVQETFKLSDGERQFLLTARRGEMLIRMNEESSVALAVPFEYEKQLITNAYINKD